MSEVVGTDPGVLSELEQITISISGQHPQDGNPHGVAFRKLLPWSRIEAALSRLSPARSIKDPENKKQEALMRLAERIPKYKRVLQESRWAPEAELSMAGMLCGHDSA